MNTYYDRIVEEATDQDGQINQSLFAELIIKECVEAVQERKIAYGRAITDRYWLEHCLRKRLGFPVEPKEPSGQ